MEVLPATLYLVATPIGNLSDITARALEVLRSVDLVACEDTRKTGFLLHHFEIKKPLISFHNYSEQGKTKLVVKELLDGKSVALVSDAGTPLVSDPGFRLVREAIRNHIRVEGIPGPCALVNALILSGFQTEPFAYFGFLPEKEKKRKELLGELVSENKTLIFYESPYRLERALKDIAAIFKERSVAVMREMTKKFEEVVRGNASEILAHFEKKKPKGEFVIVIEGAK